MTIYIDSDYRCYTENAEGRRAVEADAFDGKEKAYIEGYRFIPEGETWTRSDGAEFFGEMISAIIDYTQILTNVAISYLDDNQAESVTNLFPLWSPDSMHYHAEDKEKGIPADRVQYDGLLYRCVQSHISQPDWIPPLVPALWVRTSTEEWPEWVQPTGAHDAYGFGAHVSHNGKHWESDMDANVFEPGVAGWHEVE